MSVIKSETWYYNGYGRVEILGRGPLTDTFLLVSQEGRQPYLVWADTKRYRRDDPPRYHSLDVTRNYDETATIPWLTEPESEAA